MGPTAAVRVAAALLLTVVLASWQTDAGLRAGTAMRESLQLAAIALLVLGCSAQASPPSTIDFAEGPIRGCDERIGPGPQDWSEYSTQVGPIAFYNLEGLANLDADKFGADDEGLYLAHKIIVIVQGSAAVTLVVPPDAEQGVSLLYFTEDFHGGARYSLDEGKQMITLQGCDATISSTASFNGGFIAAGAGCVPVDVYVDCEFEDRLEIPFGETCV